MARGHDLLALHVHALRDRGHVHAHGPELGRSRRPFLRCPLWVKKRE